MEMTDMPSTAAGDASMMKKQQHGSMGPGEESLATFIVTFGLTLFAVIAVFGLIVQLTRAPDVIRWRTVSDTSPSQATYTIDWELRADGVQRSLTFQSDYQLLNNGIVVTSAPNSFPLEHLPANMHPQGPFAEGIWLFDVTMGLQLNQPFNSATMLLLPDGTSAIFSKTVIVVNPSIGVPFDIFFAGFINSPALATVTNFYANDITYRV
jgi:hypothetical protein